MNDFASLAFGIACAGIGGELFVRAAVGLSQWARIPPGIIGATVAAFATSSPELAVSVSAAMAGRPEISLGDALGSNVVNVALILGLTLSVSGIRTTRDSVKRDFPVALLVPPVTAIFIIDGVLSRTDGILMLCMFLAWLVAAIVEARKQRSATTQVLGGRRGLFAVFQCIAGLVLLVVAGRLVVSGAKGIAISFGMDVFVVGATVVAVGTSVPELATALVAKLRGHDEIGIGTILGSNIFNGLFIIAVAAVISPISIDWREAAVALVFGLFAVALTYPPRSGFVGRWRGGLLLALYVAYLAAILLWEA